MIWFDISWSEFFAVFIACALKPGIAGIPTAVFVFGFNFFETFIVSTFGGIFGTFFSAYLIEAILRIYDKLKKKYFQKNNNNKRKFTKTNRLIIKIKHNFGIVGISIISPLFLSIPLGVFLCLKFFGNRKKVIFWMSIFVMFWSIVLHYLLTHFRNLFSNLI